ncbi:MAG: hypothetical protein HWE23_11090 [Rhodobacteraceae bacterium]|nr:hypothetical protein [Paracoccaceae bacterium]
MRQDGKEQTLPSILHITAFTLSLHLGCAAVNADSSGHPCLEESGNETYFISDVDKRAFYLTEDKERFFLAGLAAVDPAVFEKAHLMPMQAIPAGPQDRWDMTPAWFRLLNVDETMDAETTENSAVLWQEVLLQEGLGLMDPQTLTEACANRLQEFERSAQNSRRGLWRRSQPLNASSPKVIEERLGQFVVIKGKIVSLGKTESTRYLNFGWKWKTDLTVTVSAKDEDRFKEHLAKADLTIEDLAKRTVQVRGWVELKDGPTLQLHTPAQLQLDVR